MFLEETKRKTLRERFSRLRPLYALLGETWMARTRAMIGLALLGRYPFVGVLDYSKTRIRMIGNSWFLAKRLRACAKEPQTVAWLEKVMQSGDVFYDIGANVGAYSFVAHSIASGDATIYAFEPGAATYARLVCNIELNMAGDSIIPLPIALAESTRLGTFSYFSTKAGAALHSIRHKKGSLNQRMMLYALDDLIERFHLKPPHLIKIDVDGDEDLVLQGMAKTLCNPTLQSLLIEIDDKNRDFVFSTLAAAGFSQTDAQYWRGGLNAIFIRNEDSSRHR